MQCIHMTQNLGYVALLVRDYDEALTFFIHSLGFTVIEDTVAKDRLGNDKRWVLVSPPGSRGTNLLLARASTPEEASRIGNQTGGRVFLFLHTDDFWHDYREMTARGVKFKEAPRQEAYGTVAVFEDLYGNKWDLLELKTTVEGLAES
jgi:catechol 2,3-dioxygenase-like lactoylglutathione lyase family enzyme